MPIATIKKPAWADANQRHAFRRRGNARAAWTPALRAVAFGGGTGLPVLLKALGTIPQIEATAIVTVTDNGGSSGRLCESFGIPAVGDLRNCLVALAESDSILADLFQHRFADGDGLRGHSLGNLIVTALCQRTGSLERAVEMMSHLLPLKGRALPSTDASATLCASFTDGTSVRGETQISDAGRRIARVWLEPDAPPAAPGVLDAIEQADTILFAPGSLYTSLLPNLLVDGVRDAVRASHAIKIFVCNLMTQPGETDGFTASDHLRALETCLGRGVIQFCIVNSTRPISRSEAADARSQCVLCDSGEIAAMGPVPVAENLALVDAHGVHHDPVALGRLVWQISRGRMHHGYDGRALAPRDSQMQPREAVCLSPYPRS